MAYFLKKTKNKKGLYLHVTVNYKYANSTNPTHHFHQRSFANSANAYPPILAPARASSGTSGSRSFIL
jgi:hypothetical protein